MSYRQASDELERERLFESIEQSTRIKFDRFTDSLQVFFLSCDFLLGVLSWKVLKHDLKVTQGNEQNNLIT